MAGPSNSEEEFLLSTWQLPATDERSMHHFQQGWVSCGQLCLFRLLLGCKAIAFRLEAILSKLGRFENRPGSEF